MFFFCILFMCFFFSVFFQLFEGFWFGLASFSWFDLFCFFFLSLSVSYMLHVKMPSIFQATGFLDIAAQPQSIPPRRAWHAQPVRQVPSEQFVTVTLSACSQSTSTNRAARGMKRGQHTGKVISRVTRGWNETSVFRRRCLVLLCFLD